jgi:hypothetical protein
MWCWNVNGAAMGDGIASSGIDVALLQEAPQPPATRPGTVVPDPTAGWATACW